MIREHELGQNASNRFFATAPLKPPGKKRIITIMNGTNWLDWIAEGTKEFKNCPQLDDDQMCTFKLSRDPNEIDTADAVLYRAFHLTPNEFYNPPTKQPHQEWIFYETEPPYRTWDKYRYHNVSIWDKMNMWITYSPEADITYGMYSAKCTERDGAAVPEGEDFSANKKDAALAIISNCLSSGRVSYIDELRKYFPVELSGSCGNKTECGGYHSQPDCEEKLMGKYKFYLSFENSFCKHYYTEKAIKTMSAETIPVVLGYENYTKIIGAGTHVNARDFKSPKDLAKHLHHLSKNKTAYNAIIARKKQMNCGKYGRNHEDMLCDMCKKLHDDQGNMKTLPDMRKLWGVKENCMNPRELFKSIAGNIKHKIRINSIYEMYGIK
jgi:hypothetical protein